MDYKIAVISPDYPVGEGIGLNMRTMNFVRAFKNYGEVDLICSRSKPEGEISPSPFRKEYFLFSKKDARDTENNREWAAKKIELLERFILGRPKMVNKWDKENEQKLTSIIIDENYDLILCRYIRNTFPLFKLPKKYWERIIVDYDDVYSGSLFDTYYKSSPTLISTIKRKGEEYLLKSYEKKCLYFGGTIFCSEKDKKAFDHIAKDCTFVIPNTFPHNWTSEEDLGDGYRNRNTFLFVGSLNYDPNVKGLIWFIESIFPKLLGRYPSTKLLIVGRNPGERIQELNEKYAEIELHVNADDVKPFYRRAGIVIVPLLSGGGTRIKILEAGIAKRVVMTTAIGADGLDLRDGEELLLFSDPESFISQYKSIDEIFRYDSIVANLKKKVFENFSFTAFVEALRNVVEKMNRENIK